MQMRSYITGSEQDRTAFHAQLEYLSRRPGLVVAGSIGRAAIYSQFNWETEPLPLRMSDGSSHAALRDIDVITPRRRIQNNDVTGPHPVGYELGDDWFSQTSNPGLVDTVTPGSTAFWPVNRTLIHPRTRRLDGQRVRTFTVGTMLAFQKMAAAGIEEWRGEPSPRHVAAHDEFEAFADSIRTAHPSEFHPDELYQPFRDATPGNKS